MSAAVIELNDCGVAVIQSGSIVASSPGIAVLKQGRVELGQAAWQSAHINPRNTFSRFWSNLNQDIFKQRTKLARHNADLAFAHLLSLHKTVGEVDKVVFAVPGSLTTGQLSLLLGLVEASPFTATGLVDAAVAATTAVAGAGRYNHLDIHLHHTVVTSLEVSETVKRTAVKVINEVGMLAVQDNCVRHIADLFIQQSRFDPLHHAATEQALCNCLTQCLHELERDADTMVEIEFENNRYQARLDKEGLVAALRPIYNKISAAVDASSVSLINQRLASLPAFTGHLAEAGSSKAVVLDECAVFTGCMGYIREDKAADEEIYFLTQLKAVSEPAITPVATTANQEQESELGATHILVDAKAHPLKQIPLYLSAQGTLTDSIEQGSLCSLLLNESTAILAPVDGPARVFVNGRAVTGDTEVKPGDVIGFTGSAHEFTLLRVLS